MIGMKKVLIWTEPRSIRASSSPPISTSSSAIGSSCAVLKFISTNLRATTSRSASCSSGIEPAASAAASIADASSKRARKARPPSIASPVQAHSGTTMSANCMAKAPLRSFANLVSEPNMTRFRILAPAVSVCSPKLINYRGRPSRRRHRSVRQARLFVRSAAGHRPTSRSPSSRRRTIRSARYGNCNGHRRE